MSRGRRADAEVERDTIAADKLRMEGASKKEIREQLGVSRTTAWRFLKDAENINWAVLGLEELAPLKRAFVEQIAERANDVLEGKLSPEAANAWRSLMDQISRVMGFEVKKVVQQNTQINIGVDPTTMGLYSRFLHECRNLVPEQMEEVFQFMRSLPRHDIDMTPPRMALPEAPEDFVE